MLLLSWIFLGILWKALLFVFFLISIIFPEPLAVAVPQMKYSNVHRTAPRANFSTHLLRAAGEGRKKGRRRAEGREGFGVGWVGCTLCSALSRFIKCCRSFSGKSVPITLWTTWMLYLSPQHIFLYVLVLSFVLFFISCSGPLLHVHVLIVCVSYIFTQCQRCQTHFTLWTTYS